MEVDSGIDFVVEKPESHSPEKHEKKKRKKREIQLANGAEAVTGDDLTATQVVEAPSSSKSGGKKSRKRKKREIQLANGAEAVTGDDLTETQVVEAPSSSKSGGKKSQKRKKREIQLANGVEAVTGDDLTETQVVDAPSSSKSGGKKSQKRKKREIQLANGAEVVTGDDLTATQIVEAPSSSKSGGKKSQKRKKEYDIADVGENGDAEMSGTTNGDGSDDKKKKREAEITKDTEAVTPGEPIEDEKKMDDALTANTKNGVEKAPYATKSSDKKSKKWDKEKVVVVGGENGAANVSDSGKGHVSNVKDVSAKMSGNKKRNKRNKRKKENNLSAGGENGNAEMKETGKDGDSDDSTTSKQMSKKNGKKAKDAVSGGPGDLGGTGAADMAGDGREGDSVDSTTSKQRPRRLSSSKRTKRVSFAGEVEVFYDKGNSSSLEENDDALVRGKRFTPEEDDLVKEAVMKFIKGNQLGKEGLQMVLNCRKYSHLRGCWKTIGASLPWRPNKAVYFRAHILFERSESRKWLPHEYEALRRLHEQYGPQWKKIAVELGKHLGQVQTAWRWMGVANRNLGNWSQEEYQCLFDLVNSDLAMKAFVEKKTMHGMLRDNISWEAISTKLSTRAQPACCLKWYKQLTSSLVSQGLWMDTDDYRLLDALQKVDACCVEDVDWGNLIEYRSGDVCRKRWEQMVRHIGGHKEKSFIEQLDVLSKRYCPQMLQYRKDEGCSNATALASGVHRPTKSAGQDT